MNTPYALIPISTLIIFFYIISLILSRIGIFSKSNHRKFWNVILLITFIVAGTIGLLLVVKINYKLDIPIYDTLLKNHVEFGIAMAIIAIFHFTWHVNYYVNIIKNKSKNSNNLTSDQIKDIKIPTDALLYKLAIFLVGFTSIITQIILLREFLSVFGGNELVIGIVLANWMILTAMGAYLGKYSLKKINYFTLILTSLILISILPVITAFLINFLKNMVFPLGVMISIYKIFFSTFILLIPFCILSGIIFTTISKYFSEIKKSNLISNIYATESIGSIIGGLLFSFVFVFLVSGFQSLLLLAIINSIGVFIVSSKLTIKKFKVISIIILSISFLLIFTKIETIARSYIFPNQQILTSKNSPFGNIIITKKAEQYNVYNNNILVLNTENNIQNEEAVHYAMLQYQSPKNILLLSGGISGQLSEILKYKINEIDYVENNRWLIKLLQDSIPELKNPKTNLIIKDPRLFLSKTDKKYDVAIINIPEPSTIHLNRFYTLEFYKLLKSRMNSEGIISFGILSGSNYMDENANNLTSTIFNTLKKVFKNVIIIQGEKNYFIASDKKLSYNIVSLINNKEIENEYVNQYYLNDELIQLRSNIIINGLIRNSKINSDLKPVAYTQQINYWLGYFKNKYWIVLISLSIIVLFLFFKSNLFSKAMFITGFSASSLEILILFSVQILIGNIYYFTGIIFTFFMVGLAGGAYFNTNIFKSINYKVLSLNQTIIGLLSLLIIGSLIVLDIKSSLEIFVYSIFIILTIITGIITGFEFSSVSNLHKGSYAEISGKTYSFDLFGSALGALIITIFIIPLLGIILSGILIATINILLALYLSLHKKI